MIQNCAGRVAASARTAVPRLPAAELALTAAETSTERKQTSISPPGTPSNSALVAHRSLSCYRDDAMPYAREVKEVGRGGGVGKNCSLSPKRSLKDASGASLHLLRRLSPAAQAAPEGGQVDASLKQPIALQTGLRGGAAELLKAEGSAGKRVKCLTELHPAAPSLPASLPRKPVCKATCCFIAEPVPNTHAAS